MMPTTPFGWGVSTAWVSRGKAPCLRWGRRTFGACRAAYRVDDAASISSSMAWWRALPFSHWSRSRISFRRDSITSWSRRKGSALRRAGRVAQLRWASRAAAKASATSAAVDWGRTASASPVNGAVVATGSPVAATPAVNLRTSGASGRPAPTAEVLLRLSEDCLIGHLRTGFHPCHGVLTDRVTMRCTWTMHRKHVQSAGVKRRGTRAAERRPPYHLRRPRTRAGAVGRTRSHPLRLDTRTSYMCTCTSSMYNVQSRKVRLR
jgi:hypothetical protein